MERNSLYQLTEKGIFNNIVRANSEAYDTNKMAEEFTHQFLDQAFSVGQQVNMAFAFSASCTLMGHICRIQGTPSIRMNSLSKSLSVTDLCIWQCHF